MQMERHGVMDDRVSGSGRVPDGIFWNTSAPLTTPTMGELPTMLQALAPLSTPLITASSLPVPGTVTAASQPPDRRNRPVPPMVQMVLPTPRLSTAPTVAMTKSTGSVSTPRFAVKQLCACHTVRRRRFADHLLRMMCAMRSRLCHRRHVIQSSQIGHAGLGRLPQHKPSSGPLPRGTATSSQLNVLTWRCPIAFASPQRVRSTADASSTASCPQTGPR